MNDAPQKDAQRRYRWPWIVWAAVALAILLAVLWMSAAVRRMREYRDPNANFSTTQPPTPNRATNQPPSNNVR